ncbi:MAG TPA: glycosyltransferase, partial [Casimicrobiaceae bacterium]|nr:glycosyltransferase [Casimicrobiaceae bacterium]
MRIPADFSDADLSGALTRVAWDPVLRTQLASNARRYIGDKHDPATIAGHFRDAIEHFAESGRTADYRALMREVAGITTTSDASREDWHATAESIAATVLRPAMRQILVDISVLVTQDLRTGIERVVRSLLQALLERSPAGWRVEPVMARGGRYWYARRFTCEWLGVAPAADDAPIDVASGDVFIGLDWAAHLVPDQEPALLHYRALGVMITFVVYDLLPVLRPDFYPPEIHTMHDAWLHTLARVADGILCISNAVAGELSTWLVSHSRSEAELPGIAVLPLGADIEHSVPSRGLPPDAEQLLEKIVGRPVVLMVGTVEPRKGYAQALAGFESLWGDGIELNLVIVGKQGWMVDEIAFKLRNHPQRGDRLYWFEGATDEWLDAIYRKADVLLAASLGEGYGLPLIEAARYGIPLIARDLPVFREVAGARAMYFSGAEGRDIAGALVDWQRARDIGNVPDSTLIERRSWRECAEAMLSIVLQGRFERPTAKPDAPHQFSAELTVRQVDLARAWLPSSVHSIKGLSAREPWGRWSDADVHPHVEIRFRQPLPVRGTVEIVGRAFGPNVEQAVPVHVGEQAFDVRFQAADTVATFSYALQEGPRSIEIIPPHPMSPRELGTSQDPRRIGIGLIRVTVRATEDVKASSEWTGSRIARLMEAEIKQRSYAPRAKDVHDQTLVTPAASPIAREAPSARKTAGIASVFEWANTLTRLRELGQRVGSLEQRFAEEQDRNERSRRRGEDALREALESVRGEIARSLDSIRGTARERLDHYALLSDQNEQLLQAVERLERDIAAIGARVQEAKSSLEKMLPPTLDDTLEVTGAPIVEPARRKCAIPASVSTPMLSADERYALFEAAFYDSAIVAAKQRVYLPYLDRELARRWPFLDLGCGRGEFLRILRDQAIASVGVDANQTALAALRIAGFDVVLADLVDFLQRDGRTYSGASALQVAEHLLPERLEQMLSLVAPRLAAGAPLIVETPNPLCPFALARFHTDPTHVVPLPPERLRFAIEAAGFERSRTLFQARVPGDPYAGPDACAYYMDYAI